MAASVIEDRRSMDAMKQTHGVADGSAGPSKGPVSPSTDSTTSKTSSFYDLPPEIIALIAIKLENQTDSLKALRSVNKTCAAICTGPLFKEVELRINKKNMRRVKRIMTSPVISRAVTHVVINTAEYAKRNMCTIGWNDRDEELPKSFNQHLTMIGSFPNLNSVYWKFSRACVGPSPRRDWWASQIPESPGFRTDVLRSLLRGLNDSEKPTRNFRSLRVQNLQDWTDETFVKSEDFRSVMERINRLDLLVAIEEDEDSPLVFMEKKELHEFFNTQLPRDWLAPYVSNLTHLKLNARQYHWGHIPKCVLPHFPALKSLSLGRMSLAHDSQLQWILSHADTLEELVLDRCPIVIGTAWYGALDAEGSPIDTTKVISTRSPSTAYYAGRWHDHLRAFRLHLTRLRVVDCGLIDVERENAPVSTKYSLQGPRLWGRRYVVFDTCKLNIPPIIEVNVQGEVVEKGAYFGDWTGIPPYPLDSIIEDLTELIKLREVVSARVGVVDKGLAELRKMVEVIRAREAEMEEPNEVIP